MNKYHNKKIIWNGEKFDSQKELKRYKELINMEKAKLISDLQRQVPFTIHDGYTKNGKKIRAIKYIADFVYYDKFKNKTIVEDTKGYRTEVYKIKKQLRSSKLLI